MQKYEVQGNIRTAFHFLIREACFQGCKLSLASSVSARKECKFAGQEYYLWD